MDIEKLHNELSSAWKENKDLKKRVGGLESSLNYYKSKQQMNRTEVRNLRKKDIRKDDTIERLKKEVANLKEFRRNKKKKSHAAHTILTRRNASLHEENIQLKAWLGVKLLTDDERYAFRKNLWSNEYLPTVFKFIARCEPSRTSSIK